MPAIGLFEDQGGPWQRVEQESLARRTERFDGGFVVRRETSHAGFNWCAPSKASMKRIEHWYELLFVRLARRLRYNNRKAANARKRLTLHWGKCGIPEAMAYARDVRADEPRERAERLERLASL
jgi:hypothetical protein